MFWLAMLMIFSGFASFVTQDHLHAASCVSQEAPIGCEMSSQRKRKHRSDVVPLTQGLAFTTLLDESSSRNKVSVATPTVRGRLPRKLQHHPVQRLGSFEGRGSNNVAPMGPPRLPSGHAQPVQRDAINALVNELLTESMTLFLKLRG